MIKLDVEIPSNLERRPPPLPLFGEADGSGELLSCGDDENDE